MLGLDKESNISPVNKKPDAKSINSKQLENALASTLEEKKESTPEEADKEPKKDRAIKFSDDKKPSEKTTTSTNSQPVDDRKIQLKMAARLGLPIADVEVKAKRAARFGATSEEEDMKNKRAKRYL